LATNFLKSITFIKHSINGSQKKKSFPRELACLIKKNMFCVFGFGFQSFPSSQIDFKPKLSYPEQFSEQEELFSNLF
jgi:hypothetical protein